VKYNEEHKKRLYRVISGCLKHVINLHGPITKKLIPSASKRLTGDITAFDKDRKESKNNVCHNSPK